MDRQDRASNLQPLLSVEHRFAIHTRRNFLDRIEATINGGPEHGEKAGCYLWLSHWHLDLSRTVQWIFEVCSLLPLDHVTLLYYLHVLGILRPLFYMFRVVAVCWPRCYLHQDIHPT